MAGLFLSAAERMFSRTKQHCASAFLSAGKTRKVSRRSALAFSTAEQLRGYNKTALVFDTETTGMVRFREDYKHSDQPDPIQLGFLLVDTTTWKIKNQGSFLIRSKEKEIEEGAFKVHGISKTMCQDYGIEHETALRLFDDLCRSADVIVGHNIKFDAMVMETAFHRNNSVAKGLRSKRHICTMMESISLCKLPSKHSKTKYKWPSLEEAYECVEGDGGLLENRGAHDALVDSHACLKIFRYLVENEYLSLETTPIEKEPDSEESKLLSEPGPLTKSVDFENADPSLDPSSDVLKEQGFRVRGNTYRHKEMIKQLGGKWDAGSKEWVFQHGTNRTQLESISDLQIVVSE